MSCVFRVSMHVCVHVRTHSSGFHFQFKSAINANTHVLATMCVLCVAWRHCIPIAADLVATSLMSTSAVSLSAPPCIRACFIYTQRRTHSLCYAKGWVTCHLGWSRLLIEEHASCIHGGVRPPGTRGGMPLVPVTGIDVSSPRSMLSRQHISLTTTLRHLKAKTIRTSRCFLRNHHCATHAATSSEVTCVHPLGACHHRTDRSSRWTGASSDD